MLGSNSQNILVVYVKNSYSLEYRLYLKNKLIICFHLVIQTQRAHSLTIMLDHHHLIIPKNKIQEKESKTLRSLGPKS